MLRRNGGRAGPGGGLTQDHLTTARVTELSQYREPVRRGSGASRCRARTPLGEAPARNEPVPSCAPPRRGSGEERAGAELQKPRMSGTTSVKGPCSTGQPRRQAEPPAAPLSPSGHFPQRGKLSVVDCLDLAGGGAQAPVDRGPGYRSGDDQQPRKETRPGKRAIRAHLPRPRCARTGARRPPGAKEEKCMKNLL